MALASYDIVISLLSLISYIEHAKYYIGCGGAPQWAPDCQTAHHGMQFKHCDGDDHMKEAIALGDKMSLDRGEILLLTLASSVEYEARPFFELLVIMNSRQ